MRSRKAETLGQWQLDDGITVVLFSGMGGACQGLEDAGCHVHVAVNHDKVAIAAHRALNPHTHHMQGDIFDIDPVVATSGRRVRALWASPDCRDHSVAKGGAPVSSRVRSMPWQVIRWAAKTKAEVIMMENVREIRGWGPLIAKRCKVTGRVLKLDGTVAAKGERVPVELQHRVRDPKRVGRLFTAFVLHLKGLGYDYQDRDLCCADYGVPTQRRRWFAVARRDGQPILWMPQTHAPLPVHANQNLKPWESAAYRVIDWSLAIPTIFDRDRPLVEATNRRIAVGVKRYVIEAAEPFLIHLTHQGPRSGMPVTGPFPTITTAARGEVALVAPHLMKYHGERRKGERGRGAPVTEPMATQTTENRFAVTAAWMVQHNTGVVGGKVTDPLRAITTIPTQVQVGAAFMVHQRGTEAPASSVRQPTRALTASRGDHEHVTAAFLTEYYGTGGQHQGIDEPLNTLSTVDRFAKTFADLRRPPLSPELQLMAKRVADFLRKYGCWDGGDMVTVGDMVIVDLGMRMIRPHEAAAAHELTLPEWIVVDGVRRRLTKTEAMKLIGNSVPKRMAMLLAAANVSRRLEPPGQRQRRAA